MAVIPFDKAARKRSPRKGDGPSGAAAAEGATSPAEAAPATVAKAGKPSKPSEPAAKAGKTPDEVPKAPKARRSKVPPRTARGEVQAAAKGIFTAPDGVELYYEDSGGPDPVLFYIYGLGCSIRHWKYALGHFAQDASIAAGRRPHRQVWMDFRGHGASPPLASGQRLTMDAIVSDIIALCEYRGITQVTFLGQSMGGSIAIAAAHAAPALTKGLVLLASPGRDAGAFLPAQPFSGWLWRGMIELNRRAPLAVSLAYAAAVRPLGQFPSLLVPMREVVRQCGFNPTLARTDDIDEYLGKVLEVDPNLFYDMADELRHFDIAAVAPPIACPALVIAGAHDRVVPLAEAKRLARHLPRGRLEIVAHGSHCPHFDDPALVHRLMETFLDLHSL